MNKNRKKVLIIDDEEDIAEVISIALKDQYEISILHSIHDPIEDIDATKPDVILLDLWIPEIGGEQVLNELRKEEKLKHIPVIIISADNQGPEIAKRSEANDFLAKPFKIKHLRELIERHLNNKT